MNKFTILWSKWVNQTQEARIFDWLIRNGYKEKVHFVGSVCLLSNLMVMVKYIQVMYFQINSLLLTIFVLVSFIYFFFIFLSVCFFGCCLFDVVNGNVKQKEFWQLELWPWGDNKLL